MSRSLVILRHAKSAWPDGVTDHERPLAPRGRREAPLVGRWLAEYVPRIELVRCSSAKRARQTWARVAAELAAAPEARTDQRLYAASVDDLLAVIREVPDEVHTALFIGHNPGLEDLVQTLSGTSCELKTSAIAVLSGTGGWGDVAPGWATLHTTATPRP